MLGWKTPRKLVVLAVDDYGNVRVHSRRARESMDKNGLRIHSRFDLYDAMETREDLEQLYDVLTSVKDKNGSAAIFTPFALPCNINFERMAQDGYRRYQYELLPETFDKLSADCSAAYEGAWRLWQEGMANGLMLPEFHGREHINLKVFGEKLDKKDFELLTALKNRSFTSISQSGYSTIKYTAAFAFASADDVAAFPEILSSGLKAFDNVFGYSAKVFTPPAHQFPLSLETSLASLGITGLDKPLHGKEHLGDGKFQTRFRATRYNPSKRMSMLVRNVVFEPCQKGVSDWVGETLKEIGTAFFWNKPAIISSHRVNFCGHIDEANRAKGLTSLRALLKAIVKKWPDVEFISYRSLSELVGNSKHISAS